MLAQVSIQSKFALWKARSIFGRVQLIVMACLDLSLLSQTSSQKVSIQNRSFVLKMLYINLYILICRSLVRWNA